MFGEGEGLLKQSLVLGFCGSFFSDMPSSQRTEKRPISPPDCPTWPVRPSARPRRFPAAQSARLRPSEKESTAQRLPRELPGWKTKMSLRLPRQRIPQAQKLPTPRNQLRESTMIFCQKPSKRQKKPQELVNSCGPVDAKWCTRRDLNPQPSDP